MLSSENSRNELRTINYSLVEIRKSSQIVQGLERLIADTKLQEVATQCKLLEPIQAIQYLQNELGKAISQSSVDFNKKGISDVLFYFLMRDKDLNPDITVILRRIWAPPYKNTYCAYRLCCEVLSSTEYFNKFYARCHHNPDFLEQLLFKHPGLLFTLRSDLLMTRLVEQLPYSKVHYILMKLINEAGRTHMFFVSHYEALAHLYADHGEDLCELLSIEDDNGRIAVDARTEYIAPLLIHNYVPKYQKKYQELLKKSTKAESDPQEGSKNWAQSMLHWLKDQVAKNRYILYGKPRVLIVFNTKNREGAEVEAASIYDAFKTTNRFDVKMINDQPSNVILQHIEESANEVDPASNLPPSALIVVIMSHGAMGVIVDVNGKILRLRSIEDAMTCRRESKITNTSFPSRPKILICQSCQSLSSAEPESNNTTDATDPRPPAVKEAAERSPKPYATEAEHFFALMAGAPGEKVERDVLIPILAKYVSGCQENETINVLVHEMAQEMEAKKVRQKPMTFSTLEADFCLANANPQFHDPVSSRRASITRDTRIKEIAGLRRTSI